MQNIPILYKRVYSNIQFTEGDACHMKVVFLDTKGVLNCFFYAWKQIVLSAFCWTIYSLNMHEISCFYCPNTYITYVIALFPIVFYWTNTSSSYSPPPFIWSIDIEELPNRVAVINQHTNFSQLTEQAVTGPPTIWRLVVYNYAVNCSKVLFPDSCHSHNDYNTVFKQDQSSSSSTPHS